MFCLRKTKGNAVYLMASLFRNYLEIRVFAIDATLIDPCTMSSAMCTYAYVTMALTAKRVIGLLITVIMKNPFFRGVSLYAMFFMRKTKRKSVYLMDSLF